MSRFREADTILYALSKYIDRIVSVAENLVKSIGGNICCVFDALQFPEFFVKTVDGLLSRIVKSQFKKRNMEIEDVM